MKKSLILIFSVLLLSSLCYAEQAPITASSDQAKVTENKKQDIVKKSVKPTVKKSAKKALLNLPKPAIQSISRLIDSLSETPYSDGCKKLSGMANTYRVRKGDPCDLFCF